jgi:AcrR family transcriptional regulator
MARTRDDTAEEEAQTRLELRKERQRAVSNARRDLILAAARAAFLESGLEGASLREIAKRAGYTPGAIYSYFASKEEMYAALLGESLERLNAWVTQAAVAPTDDARTETTRRAHAQTSLRAHATAFFEFYRENPRDLDLGFYLFHGMQPRGLTAELNKRLNARLLDALAPVRTALIDLGLPATEALAETTALFAHAVGLLLLSHTGRIRMFRQQSEALFERYLDQLVARSARPAKSPR